MNPRNILGTILLVIVLIGIGFWGGAYYSSHNAMREAQAKDLAFRDSTAVLNALIYESEFAASQAQCRADSIAARTDSILSSINTDNLIQHAEQSVGGASVDDLRDILLRRPGAPR